MSYLKDLLGDEYKEEMSEDEISAAIQKKLEAQTSTINNYKTLLSKANSEAADYKKQLRSKIGDDEAKKLEQQEMLDALKKENDEMKKSIVTSEKMTKLLALGYDENLAKDTATAMVEGDFDTVLTNQSKFLEIQKKNVLAEKLKETPRPAAGGIDVPNQEYDKIIQEATASGDFSTAAYYTRLAQQNTDAND